MARAHPKGGFTLIELLAVVAILLILIAILLPVAGRIYERGGRLICFNNMRQLQSGSLVYASEHEGRFISSLTETYHGAITNLNCWAKTSNLTAGVLWPYILSERTYLCPGFPKTEQGMKFKRHYSVSAFIGSTDGEGGVHQTHYVARSFGEIKNLSKVLCFAEEYYNNQYIPGPYPGALHAYCVGVSPHNTGMVLVDPPPMWHDAGANWSFMDGHCEYKRWEGRKALSYDIDTWRSSTMGWAGDPADERDYRWLAGGTTSGWIRPYP